MGIYRSKQRKISCQQQKLDDTQQNKIVSRYHFIIEQKYWEKSQKQPVTIWIVHSKYQRQKYFMKCIKKDFLYKNRKIKYAFNELEILKLNSNPKIIQLYHAFQDKKHIYQILEYIQGWNLDRLIKFKTFTQAETKILVCFIIRILEYIHQKRYVVACLQPQNIIVQEKTGKLKIINLLGVVEMGKFSDNCIPDNLNLYSAPEILTKDRALPESDFYSLGLIMYSLIKQKIHIQAEDRKSILQINRQIQKSDLPEGWSPQAADFLIKLLVKAPQYRLGRYGSIQLRKHQWLINYDWVNAQQVILIEGINQEKNINNKFEVQQAFEETKLTRTLFKNYSFTQN